MSAQPVEPHRPHPRTQDEIGAALPPSQRMAFYRDMGSADEHEIAGVLRRWRLRLELYNDPATARTHAEVQQGVAPGRALSAVLRELDRP
ncbi:hypothetical protein ADK60_09065 [Streptomyces sp. XY431]|uniref:hypothetical protein n=1 Tax=Streptomyces sp. XY431 TaxID=1415562 RepID=UPI0006AE42F6|nr:hypothetical protein [Streptomyces sp. XY431]KOV35392.1 hypothetical protein ADK60_09065 [Streptomyces sp. XY431]